MANTSTNKYYNSYMELTPGKCYFYTSPYTAYRVTFRYGTAGASRSYMTNKIYYTNELGLGSAGGFRDCSPEQVIWLEACEAAGKYINRRDALKNRLENYQIY